MLDELMIQATAFADAVHAGDRDAVVPTCPEWTLLDLARHVGRVYRRVALTVAERRETLVPHDEVPDAEPPETVDATSTWLLEGAAMVTAALREAGGNTLVAGFLGPTPASFWARRMVHETLVHRFDAEVTAGVDPWTDVGPELAIDAVAEGFELLGTYGDRTSGLAGRGETVHVHATDVEGEWVVTRAADGVVVERAHRTADVAVRGPAVELLAVLTNRRGTGEGGVDVLGDAAVLAGWLRAAAL